MRILLSIPNAGLSGAEKQLLMLAIGLKEKGYDIKLCNLDGKGHFTKKAQDAGLACKVISRRSRFDMFRLFNYGKFISQGKFDVVISFTSSANNLTRLVKVFSPFANFFHIAGERGRDLNELTILNWIDSKLSKLSDVIICNSKTQRKKLIATEKVAPEKIHVIYNGFDFSQCEDIIPVELHNEFGIPKGNRVICSVGNLSDHKNIPMYMNVAEKVLSKSDSISFLYVGDGPDLEKYRGETTKRRLTKKVFFIGRRNDVLAILKSCNIFILTSTWEGLPNVLIEAMVSMLPVVSTNIDGVTEIITDRNNGLVVESGDTNSMVDKINQLLGDDILCDSLCDSAFETASSMFDMDKMIASYEKFIRNAGIS